MGTRTTIKIMQDGEVIASLYRHWDGYPAETGADLLETALQHDNGASLATALLDKRYKQADHESAPRKIYKIEATAGDIEHFYIAAYNWQETVKFLHAARPDWETELNEWTQTANQYTASEFTELINKDRAGINARLKVLKEKNPTLYKDSDPYPMITGDQIK